MTPSSLSTLNGHSAPVTALGFSENNQRLVSGSADNTVRFWDVANPAAPRELQDLSAHASALVGVAVLGDNAQVVSAGADNKVRVWKPAAVRVFAGHQGPVFGVAVHPNGSQLATWIGRQDGVAVFDVNGGNEIRNVGGFGEAVRAVVYSKDQQKLVAGSVDKTIRSYNAGNGQPMLTYQAGGPVTSLAIGADNKTLAAGLGDPPSVKLFDLSIPDPLKAEVQVVSGFAGPVLAVALGPDNQTLVGGSARTSRSRSGPCPRRARSRLSPATGARSTACRGRPTRRSSRRVRPRQDDPHLGRRGRGTQERVVEKAR